MQERRRAAPAPKMDRRNFLRLGGAGLAGAVLLGTAGGSVLAQATPSVKRDFEAAAEKYDVPVELLLAMGYVNTMWEMPAPSPFDPEDLHGSGTYGILQLRRTPSEDTLGRAASLTGLPVEELKTDRASNILGGAAVLARMAGENKPSDLNGWYEIVVEYEDSAGYANEVYEVLEDGTTKETSSGERVALSSHPEAETRSIPTSRDRGEAPGSTWYGNGGRNRTNMDRGPAKIDKIVIHVGQDDYWGILNWFKHPDNDRASAHYTVSKQGAIGQSVKEEDMAWHAGHLKTNRVSIGIEHAGYVKNGDDWFTEDMYRASARLTAYLSKRYKIPLDRRHVIAHHQVPGCSGLGGGISCHTDPSYVSNGRLVTYWRWGHYMDLVKRFRRRM